MDTTIVNAISSSGATSGVWISPQVVAAIIAFFGVLIGLVARDIIMSLYLMKQKRSDDLEDRQMTEEKSHKDLVRLYSDPLKDAVISLKFRLREIVERKQARYLLSDAPKIPFLEYKRISTLYRIASVLGWIRAIRRERSYIDPQQASKAVEMQAIGEFETALADGAHVELQRLDELMITWRVKFSDVDKKSRVASLIDGERAEYLAAKGVLSPRDLSDCDQIDLAQRCAEIIRREIQLDIPSDLVIATAKQTAVIFGIKEAYIYRDWQAAIGDLMLQQEKIGSRHFSVLGFGTFEDMIIEVRKNPQSNHARWFDRLERLIHDLDMNREGMFDARREQLRQLYQCCIKLETGLEERVAASHR